jgi:hypothetical protein
LLFSTHGIFFIWIFIGQIHHHRLGLNSSVPSESSSLSLVSGKIDYIISLPWEARLTGQFSSQLILHLIYKESLYSGLNWLLYFIVSCLYFISNTYWDQCSTKSLIAIFSLRSFYDTPKHKHKVIKTKNKAIFNSFLMSRPYSCVKSTNSFVCCLSSVLPSYMTLCPLSFSTSLDIQ